MNFFIKKEIKKILEKELPKIIDGWKDLDVQQKQKIFDLGMEYFYTIAEENLKKANTTLTIIKQHCENYSFLFLGTLLGITGGMLANILHGYFLKFPIAYPIFVFFIFLAVLLYGHLSINYKNNMCLENDKLLVEFLKHLKTKNGG